METGFFFFFSYLNSGQRTLIHAVLGQSRAGGLPSCVQVNPHKRLRHQYGSRMMAQYRDVLQGELSPHVYAIAEQARRRSRRRC